MFLLSKLLPPKEFRRVAVTADVDPRTLDMYARGRTQRRTTARIEAALRNLGYAHLIRDEDGEINALPLAMLSADELRALGPSKVDA